ncbi:MAG: hypothetical protein ACLR0U_03055 [Enterocloster clostridioformis]
MEYALKHGEFKVYLQPKVGLDDLGLIGAETLVRRQHEDGRIIPSGELEMLWKMGCEVGSGPLFFKTSTNECIFEKYCRKMIDKS